MHRMCHAVALLCHCSALGYALDCPYDKHKPTQGDHHMADFIVIVLILVCIALGKGNTPLDRMIDYAFHDKEK